CQGASETRPFVPLKTAFSFFALFFLFIFSDMLFSALFSALFPALVQPHYLRLSQPKDKNKDSLPFVCIGL
ncbi:MAG: hypothetical protein ACLSIK_05325, partial [Enterocloster clostridioformis]|uniref:hypothetical protein n=1 Tax=Enterocloster clostridioformis TaxID=1531 RepID=UPI0039915A33